MSWRGVSIGLAAGLLLGFGLAAALPALRQASAQAGPVDVGFGQTMLAHHDQAVLMTQIVLAGPPGQLDALARSMQTAQLLEMGQMRGWLNLWNRPLLASGRGMDWMRYGAPPPGVDLVRYLADCRASPGGMPGLASSAELNALRAAQGAVRERLFLDLMIRHHQGGLPMARFAAANAALPVVRALAAQIAFDQAQEVERMSRLLAALPGDASGRAGSP